MTNLLTVAVTLQIIPAICSSHIRDNWSDLICMYGLIKMFHTLTQTCLVVYKPYNLAG